MQDTETVPKNVKSFRVESKNGVWHYKKGKTWTQSYTKPTNSAEPQKV